VRSATTWLLMIGKNAPGGRGEQAARLCELPWMPAQEVVAPGAQYRSTKQSARPAVVRDMKKPSSLSIVACIDK